jgi:hypothetical protein
MNGVQAHLWVNHIPVFGLALSAAVGIYAYYNWLPKVLMIAHLFALGAHTAGLLAFFTGEMAFHMLAEVKDTALNAPFAEVHEDIAHDFVLLFWLGLGLQSILLALLWRRRKLPPWLHLISVAWCILALVVCLVIAHSGGEIRHIHIR